VMPIL